MAINTATLPTPKQFENAANGATLTIEVKDAAGNVIASGTMTPKLFASGGYGFFGNIVGTIGAKVGEVAHTLRLNGSLSLVVSKSKEAPRDVSPAPAATGTVQA